MQLCVGREAREVSKDRGGGESERERAKRRHRKGKHHTREGPPTGRTQTTSFLHYTTRTLTYSPYTTGTPFTMEAPAIHAACMKPQDHSAAAR